MELDDQLNMAKPQYIAALDVGTTTIRCFIFNEDVNTIGSAKEQVHFSFVFLFVLFVIKRFDQQVNLIYPKPGFVEIDPDQLWNSVIKTIENAVKDAKLELNDVTCLGISTQRSTFVTWDKVTGKTFHNFVTWKDIRADALVKKWNSSFIIKVRRISIERGSSKNILSSCVDNAWSFAVTLFGDTEQSFFSWKCSQIDEHTGMCDQMKEAEIEVSLTESNFL